MDVSSSPYSVRQGPVDSPLHDSVGKTIVPHKHVYLTSLCTLCYEVNIPYLSTVVDETLNLTTCSTDVSNENLDMITLYGIVSLVCKMYIPFFLGELKILNIDISQDLT